MASSPNVENKTKNILKGNILLCAAFFELLDHICQKVRHYQKKRITKNPYQTDGMKCMVL